MHHSNGIDVAGAIARARSHVRGSQAEAELRRLEWVLCAGFADVGAVEDAFEAAYVALTDADQSTRRFEAASGDLERAYDAWLAAALARATEIPAPPPLGGGLRSIGPSRPTSSCDPTKGPQEILGRFKRRSLHRSQVRVDRNQPAGTGRRARKRRNRHE